jgi:hypothetical protein
VLIASVLMTGSGKPIINEVVTCIEEIKQNGMKMIGIYISLRAW